MPHAPAVVVFVDRLAIAKLTMNSDIAHEMSVKSIASAITGDDAAVRPRSFRRDGAVLPARALQRRARLPGRDATLLLNGVGDRVNTQRAPSASLASRMVPKSRQASRQHCQAACGRPGVLPTLPCPVSSESLPKLPIRPALI
jgi:hypothetical protein